MHQQLVEAAEQKLDESTSKDAASQEHADNIQKQLAEVIADVSCVSFFSSTNVVCFIVVQNH